MCLNYFWCQRGLDCSLNKQQYFSVVSEGLETWLWCLAEDPSLHSSTNEWKDFLHSMKWQKMTCHPMNAASFPINVNSRAHRELLFPRFWLRPMPILCAQKFGCGLTSFEIIIMGEGVYRWLSAYSVLRQVLYINDPTYGFCNSRTRYMVFSLFWKLRLRNINFTGDLQSLCSFRPTMLWA